LLDKKIIPLFGKYKAKIIEKRGKKEQIAQKEEINERKEKIVRIG
jgi:hypothetical protein